jgi:ABC-type transporter Mla subunit MlaD
MAHDNVLVVLAIVVTVAILMQAGAMLGMWLAVRQIPGKIDQIRSDVRHHIDPLTQSVTELLVSTREPLRTVTANLAEISQMLRERSSQVDAVMEDFVDKSRRQIIRADQLLSNLADKVEATTGKVEQTILTPIHEFSAVIKGLQSGLDFLFFRRRPAGASETAPDEQLFI